MALHLRFSNLAGSLLLPQMEAMLSDPPGISSAGLAPTEPRPPPKELHTPWSVLLLVFASQAAFLGSFVRTLPRRCT